MVEFIAKKFKAIVIGGSSGSFVAISSILAGLPKDFAVPIFIVQHQVEDFNTGLVDSYSEISSIKVVEGCSVMPIEPHTIYLAPSGYHMLIEKSKVLGLCSEPRFNFALPAIDVLFDTAAEVYNSDLLGIILTGASNDGCQGLQKVSAYGGITIVQDPKTAKSTVMPKAAIVATQVDYILSISEIISFLQKEPSYEKPRITKSVDCR